MTEEKYLKVIELLTEKVEVLESDFKIQSWKLEDLKKKLATAEEEAKYISTMPKIEKAVNTVKKEIR